MSSVAQEGQKLASRERISPAVQIHREQLERQRQKDSRQQLQQLRACWEVCHGQIEKFFEDVETQTTEVFDQEDITPRVKQFITYSILSMFGLSPTQPLVEAQALEEALMERISSPAPSSWATSAYAERDKVGV